MRGLIAFQADKSEENNKWNKENIVGTIVDKQAGYILYVTGLIYTRAIMEQGGVVVNKR